MGLQHNTLTVLFTAAARHFTNRQRAYQGENHRYNCAVGHQY